jgi:hypothetical protein
VRDGVVCAENPVGRVPFGVAAGVGGAPATVAVSVVGVVVTGGPGTGARRVRVVVVVVGVGGREGSTSILLMTGTADSSVSFRVRFAVGIVGSVVLLYTW